jgi:hypothetical protein
MLKPEQTKCWAYYLLIALGLAALTGCGPDVARWKEEVLLHDGRMIVVERMATAEVGGFPNANRGRDLEFELKYAPLGIYWKGTQQHTMLEIFDGVPYLVVWPGSESKFCKDKLPTTLPIRILKMQGKEWIEIEQETFPVDIANFNLYLSYWGNKASEDARGLITWTHKEDTNAYPIVKWDPLIRRPYKLRERYVSTNGTCARFQNPNK